MGKKGKGRQSGTFQSKKERASHVLEWKQSVSEIRGGSKSHSNHHRQRLNGSGSSSFGRSISSDTTVALQGGRPRLTRLGQLKGILRERMFQESQDLLQRRRRAGFVPQPVQAQTSPSVVSRRERNAPGKLLFFQWDPKDGKINQRDEEQATPHVQKIESLQAKCVRSLSRYLPDYLEAMGKEDLHAALSLLPADTLAMLSVSVSKGTGVSNTLAYVLGKHAHIEKLCLRSNMYAVNMDNHKGKNGESVGYDDGILTDEGLFQLVPRRPESQIYYDKIADTDDDDGYEETWEDWEDAYEEYITDNHQSVGNQQHPLVMDVLELDGINVGLKRLELIDCLYISATSVLALLEKCSCITHLSLAGSVQSVEDGEEILIELPNLLPALEVLDVNGCGWISGFKLQRLRKAYEEKYTFRTPPKLEYDGFLEMTFTPHRSHTEDPFF